MNSAGNVKERIEDRAKGVGGKWGIMKEGDSPSERSGGEHGYLHQQPRELEALGEDGFAESFEDHVNVLCIDGTCDVNDDFVLP